MYFDKAKPIARWGRKATGLEIDDFQKLTINNQQSKDSRVT
jgi:hypothetical protein